MDQFSIFIDMNISMKVVLKEGKILEGGGLKYSAGKQKMPNLSQG